MPARKIPMNYRNVTGVFPSVKSIGCAGFESTLERDFLTILDFDYEVEKFEVQPVQINYKDENNKDRIYTPDVFVQYRSYSSKVPPRCMLYEVKYRKDLKEKWKELKPKFKAGIHFAKSKGWNFKIITDTEIRRPYLDNIKFLRSYNIPIEDHRMETASSTLINLQEATPEILVAALAQDFSNRAEALFLVWQMLARGYMYTDLTKPLSMSSPIWIP